MPDGGSPLIVDVNAPYVGLEFHYIYQLIMGSLVFLIIPGQFIAPPHPLALTFSLTTPQVSAFSTAAWPDGSLLSP